MRMCFTPSANARVSGSTMAMSEHFRVPAAPPANPASKRPPSPPSLDSVQSSYGFGYAAHDVKTEGEKKYIVCTIEKLVTR